MVPTEGLELVTATLAGEAPGRSGWYAPKFRVPVCSAADAIPTGTSDPPMVVLMLLLLITKPEGSNVTVPVLSAYPVPLPVIVTVPLFASA